MATWTIVSQLGRGGNGIVYKVVDAKGDLSAMKVIHRIRAPKAYKRFKDEVRVLLELRDEPGVMPIVDHFLPDVISEQSPPYYVMPLATRFQDHILQIEHADFYSLFFELCQTLVRLHERGITHRDIKPDNILMLNGAPVFADFGLANFPAKRKVSSENEKIGPRWTIAPEMERISSIAEYKKADIYSFAKTLWILITKQWFGFEGQYIKDSPISVRSHVRVYINEMTRAGEWHYVSTVLLDELLISATDNDSTKRPDAQQFFDKLKFWFDSNDKYGLRNPYEWVDALTRIFPVSVPSSSTWDRLDDIVAVLKVLSCDYDNLNHSFYPGRGGLDITKVAFAKEDGAIILNDREIVKPRVLTFESLGDMDWSYFRLELTPLAKLNSEYFDENSEEIFMDLDGHYHIVNRYERTNSIRWYRGAFLIARKTSPINLIGGKYNAYNGHHDKMSSAQYKEFIKKLMLSAPTLESQT